MGFIRDTAFGILKSRQNAPAAGAPPGVTPNFVDPVTRGPMIQDVSASLCTLALVLVLLRVYTKLVMTKSFGVDDWLCIAAMACAITRVGLTITMVKDFQFGRHTWDIYPWNYDPIIRFMYISDMIYLLGMIFTKVSILYWYISIFRVNRTFVHTCYAVMAFCSIYCTIFIFIYAFACSPERKTWNVTTVPGECFDMIKVLRIIGGFNLSTDVVILLLPIPLVSRLKLQLKEKLGVLAVLATGAVVAAATIVRQVFVVTSLSNADQAWGTVDHMLWLTVEFTVGITCGCFLVVTPLYKYVFRGEMFEKSLRTYNIDKERRKAEAALRRTGHRGEFTGRIWAAGESEIELGKTYKSRDPSTCSAQRVQGILQTKSVEVEFSSAEAEANESEENIPVAQTTPEPEK